MTLSVGLARIVQDPEATVLTRQALGRLGTPGLLVTDKGLTIDTNGRIVLRLAPTLAEDSNGLRVRVAPDGGIVLSEDGIALAPFEDIVCNNIVVNQNATIDGVLLAGESNVTGNSTVGGDLGVTGNLTADVVNSTNIINSGNITSDTADFADAVSVGGDLSCANMSTPGAITATGNVTANAVLTNSVITTTITSGSGSFSGNMLIGGTLGVTGNSTLASATVTGNATVGGTLGVTGATTVGTLNAGAITGSSLNASSANISGNAVVGGTLNGTTMSATTLSATTVNATTINAVNAFLTGGVGTAQLAVNGGTTIVRILSYFTTLSLGLGAGTPDAPQDFFVAVPGAGAFDLVICNPLFTPGINIESWSASMNGAGNAMIRIGKSGILGSTTAIDFRITVIGFL